MRTRLLLGTTRTLAVFGALVIASTTLLAPSASAGPGTITGQVFNDFGADGTMNVSAAGQTDSGIAGLTVTAYGAAGACGSTTTAADGTYSLVHSCTTNQVRVEFSTSPNPTLDGLQSGPLGQPGAAPVVSGSSVQFVAATSTGVNAGFLRPTDYCQANPDLIASCFYNGAANNDLVNNKAISKWSYGSSGIPGFNADKLAGKPALGAIFGLAHSRSRNKIYASTVLRRHVGLGPSGLGAIYSVDDASGAVTLLKDLGSLVGTFDESARGLGASFSPSHDDAAAVSVGKVGFGDLAITEDEANLLFANLYTGEIMLTPVDSSTSTTSLGAPNPGCGSSVAHPWGVAVRGSKVYAGVACEDASLGAVMSTPLTGGTWTTEVSLPFGVMTTPGTWSDVAETWKPWSPWPEKQPIVSDISFDADGSMSVSIMDRRGYITASNNYDWNSNNLASYGTTAGDLVRACLNGTTYQLESGGTCGSFNGAANGQGRGGGEFYSGDGWFTENGPSQGHHEISLGATAILPGRNELVSTAFDVASWLSYGARTYSQTNGLTTRSYQLVADPNTEPGSLGKAAGMGDVELLCDQAPLEIGNRVWNDANGDGEQDPDEAAIAGVTVRLIDTNGNELSSAVTNSLGVYSFSSGPGTGDAAQKYGIAGLTPQTSVTVEVPASQSVLTGFSTTRADAASISDAADSDGTPMFTNGAQVTFSTSLAGHDDHTIDFGFVRTFSLGNRVFIDTDNSGLMNGAETGAAGVPVRLYRQSGGLTAATDALGNTVAMATTDASGFYRFDNLVADDYVVVVDPNATALAGTTSSSGSGQSSTPNDNIDSDDNGIDTPLGSGTVFPGGIASGVVTLGPGAAEPTGDTDAPTPNPAGEAINAQSNRTLDFGFAPPPPTTTTSSTTSSTTTSTTSSTTTTDPTTTSSTTTTDPTTTSSTTTSSTTTSTTTTPTTLATSTSSTAPSTTSSTTTTDPTTTSSSTTSSTTTSSTTTPSTVATTQPTTTQPTTTPPTSAVPTTVTTTDPAPSSSVTTTVTTAVTTAVTTPASTVEPTLAATTLPTPILVAEAANPDSASTTSTTSTVNEPSTTVDASPGAAAPTTSPQTGSKAVLPAAPSGPATGGSVVTGVIFVDTNSDGVHEDSEKLLEGVTVEVRAAAGNLVGTTVTDEVGRFSMPVESTGTFTVTIVAGVPPEYSFLTDQTISVEVMSSGVSKSEAVFRVASSVDELAFTGSLTTRMLLIALGCLITGGALLASRRIRRLA